MTSVLHSSLEPSVLPNVCVRSEIGNLLRRECGVEMNVPCEE